MNGGIFVLYNETAFCNAMIFNHAFEILYKRLEEGVKKLHHNRKNKVAQRDSSLVIPVLTNGAFACELYIKSLLPPNTRGHELYELYNRLDDELKDNIQKIHLDYMQNYEPNYNLEDFYNDIQIHSNVFVTWRYFHDCDTASAKPPFIYIFLKALYTVGFIEKTKNILKIMSVFSMCFLLRQFPKQDFPKAGLITRQTKNDYST